MAILDAPQIEFGEVFTRRWVVETILDLVGYTSDRDLGSMRLVEPSIGSGRSSSRLSSGSSHLHVLMGAT